MNIAFERMKKRLVRRDVVRPDATLGLISGQLTRDVAADAATLHITAMTDRVALDRLVVVPRGCDTTYIDANKRVFLDHDTDFYSCVGTIRDRTIADTGITANVGLAKAHEDYDQLVAMIREVGVGTSIGFEVTEMTPPMKGDPPHYFQADGIARQWRWLELSLTMMPCDVFAQAEGQRMAGPVLTRSLSRMRAAGTLSKRLIQRLSMDEVLDAPERRRIVVSVRQP